MTASPLSDASIGGPQLGASSFFRDLVDLLPVAIYATDAEGRLIYFNRAAVEFAGRVPSLGVDRWCVNVRLYHSDGAPMPLEECPMAIALKERRVVRGCEAMILRPDGTRLWFEPYPTPLFDSEGTLVGGINMLLDVTARKEADVVKAKLAAIVESSDDAILSKDLEGTVSSWNRAAERLFGYTAGEMVGQPITKIIPPDRADEEAAMLQRVQQGEPVDHFETVRRRKDGTPIDIALTISPVRDGNGRIVGASKIARDITDRRRAEAASRDSDRRKDEFLAMLAHELRNPLAAIRNAVSIQQIAGTDPRTLDRVREMMDRQVAHMVRLIDDLLDVSRIGQGKIELKVQPTDLSTVVNHALEVVQPACEAKGLDLTVTLPVRPLYAECDAVRLTQALGNVLNNAWKYTEPGGRIRITLERSDDQAIVRVEDTGIGIAAEQLSRIFELFTQVDSSPDRTQGGLGIGLTLAKQLAELHGGTLEARSAGLGQGSEFVMRLAALAAPKPSAPAPSEAASSDPVPKRRILVVDDNHDAAASLAILLELGGHDVHVAHDGLEAVDAAAAQQPDVILLDLGLPKLNGRDVARRIRAQDKGTRAMIVAVTGWGQDAVQGDAEDADFDAHLVKPVDPAVLTRLLAEAKHG